MNKLFLCILIPTYNGGKVIAETLRTLFSQSYTNYEVIISDDCSSDNTLAVVVGLSAACGDIDLAI